MLSLVLLCAPLTAVAETPTERLVRIQKALDLDESHVKIWWFGWTGVMFAAGAVQTGMSVASDDPAWVSDRLVGATNAWIGVAGMALTPVRPLQRWTPLPDLPVSAQLRIAEAELRDRAKREGAVGGWLDHALVVVLAVGTAAFLYYHEHRPVSAALAGSTNLVFGEFQLWSIPHTAIKAVKTLDDIPLEPEPQQ